MKRESRLIFNLLSYFCKKTGKINSACDYDFSYTIGETVIDLIFKNMQPQAAKVGGSALNTSVSLGRLGNRVSFISEIGTDELGDWCKRFLADNGVADWSDLFDAGHEWYGACCWSIYDKSMNRYVVMLVSATD